MHLLVISYIPTLLDDEGVAAGVEAPNWVAAGVSSVDGAPFDDYVGKVFWDGRLAAAEPRAPVAVVSCGVQANARGDAAAVVARALQQRQRVAAYRRELVSCRRDQEQLDVVCNTGGGAVVQRAVAEGRHGNSEAYLAGLHRDVDDLGVAQVWSRRVELLVASEVVLAMPGTRLADAKWVGNIYITATVRAVRPWTCWQRR